MRWGSQTFSLTGSRFCPTRDSDPMAQKLWWLGGVGAASGRSRRHRREEETLFSSFLYWNQSWNPSDVKKKRKIVCRMFRCELTRWRSRSAVSFLQKRNSDPSWSFRPEHFSLKKSSSSFIQRQSFKCSVFWGRNVKSGFLCFGWRKRRADDGKTQKPTLADASKHFLV